MSSPRKRRDRPRRTSRFLFFVTACLALLLTGQGLSAAPLGVNFFYPGDLWEFDLTTGEFWLAVPFDPPVECNHLTGTGDTLFCAKPVEFEGTWVRRLERSSASVVWQVAFPDLPSPDGIVYSDSLLYVVANANQASNYYLLTLDPATGEELARVELTELGIVDGNSRRPFALAARDSELWLLTTGDFTGMSISRLDPLTGLMHESFTVPGVFSVSDADFGPGGRLFVSHWEWNPINTGWCTDHWMVPFLGALPELQFSHCWEMPDPPVPSLAYFTLANRDEETPIVEVPTLGAVPACVLAVLLCLAGVLILRGSAERAEPGRHLGIDRVASRRRARPVDRQQGIAQCPTDLSVSER